MISSDSLLKKPSVIILINGNVIDKMDVYNNSNTWYATYFINKSYNGTVSFIISDYYNYGGNYGYTKVKSSFITIITTQLPSPFIKYFECYTGSTKTSLNNRLDIVLSSRNYKWDYSTDGGVSYSTFDYNSVLATLYLPEGIYLPDTIIIRHYDRASNVSQLTNTKTVTIATSSTGFPLVNSSTNTSSKIKKANYIRIYSK